VHVTVVAPPSVRSLLLGSESAEVQVAKPGGTMIVSPLVAAVMQSFTSARLALAAVRVGLDPLHTASASPAARI
jgi:hypothetical protein